MLEEPDIKPESLENIDIPILVTAGENDMILLQETESISDHLPQSELVILKEEDHGSYVIGSEVIGKYLIEFLVVHY